MNNNKWKDKDLFNILHNPVLTGIGPFPKLISDKLWAQAMVKSVDEIGIEPALIAIQKNLKDSIKISFKALSGREWVEKSSAELQQIGAERFFKKFLAELRILLKDDHYSR